MFDVVHINEISFGCLWKGPTVPEQPLPVQQALEQPVDKQASKQKNWG
jgi:hypothetical protein